MPKTCKQIRQEFIDFFLQRGHTLVPSSSLLPAEDPTLLFTNAGMNQFKDIFLGRETRDYDRAANSQKCIRAGGKHNDLEDVGHDSYHHTFFEMLGNWSFGDYFKAEAIRWAWELLTEVWKLPKERLHVTVFEGDAGEGLEADDEAQRLWLEETDIHPSHIHLGNKKDNFWEMGDTGPCGPCSEIHYDFTPDLSGGRLVNAGDARVIEIWNLVFMQFNRGADGKLSPLPACHVDTGMGFERICRVLQGVDSNYGIDVFRGIFEATAKLGASKAYGGSLDDLGDVAYRVIADHARTLTFAIADGVMPSNEGRGYVVRRILRRAARYGRQYLGMEGPFLVKLVPTVVELMGEAFPEIAARRKQVEAIIKEEEESFGRTLDRGIELFNKQVGLVKTYHHFAGTGRDKVGTEIRPNMVFVRVDRDYDRLGKDVLPGDVAFELYATYGFPVDLTQLMASEKGLTVDMAGFNEAMNRHREISAGGGDKFKVEAIVGLPETDDSAKYDHSPIEATVLGWVVDSKYVSDGQLSAPAQAAVVLDRTNFYGEQGGQVGDKGELTWPGGRLVVESAQIAGQCVLHRGKLEAGELRPGQQVTATVAPDRMDTMRNHTATHLLNWALRQVLGDHVHQAGSVVAPDRLRFDFAHGQALTDEQIQAVERLANERVLADEVVSETIMPLAQARKLPGVQAVFGEKYPDPVRVIAIGSSDPAGACSKACSAEFCGGTHLSRTSQVGMLKVVSQEAVAKGVRRVTAVTGKAAFEHVSEMARSLRALQELLRTGASELPGRVEAMQKEIKELKRKAVSGAASSAAARSIETPAGKVLLLTVEHTDTPAIRTLCDSERQKGAVAVMVGGAAEDKVTLVAMVDDALAGGGKLRAGDWVNAAAAVVGGKGGGKPTMAQAGGKGADKLPEAMEKAAQYAKDVLK